MHMKLSDLKHTSLELLLRTWACTRANSFEKRDPLDQQRKTLAYLTGKGSSTRFGKDHHLAELARKPFDSLYEAYRQRIPIRTYDDFWREYFSCGYCRNEGEKTLNLTDVTWPGKISLFCETSGTTAPTKYIPFSPEMFAANKRAALDLAACYLHGRRESRLTRGKLLYMAGNTQLNDLGNGVKSGDMSAITLLHPPPYLRSFILPDPAVSALPWDEKLTALARLLLADPDIRAISGVPPWILLLLKRCMELGRGSLPELLPNLELIIHGGTSLKPYRKEFEGLFAGYAPHFLELLPSSEAFMAFQVPGEEYMRFTPYYGVFFEFLPFEELDERGAPKAGAVAVPLEEVQAGRCYAIILSTCAGLWRYHIGDTIRFVSVAPLMIEFMGRDRFLDRFEEKVTQREVEEAVAELTQNGIAVKEFIVGPDIDGRRHLWILAVDGNNGTGSSTIAIAKRLDSSVMRMNADYATFRSQGRIAEPAVMTVDPDLIYRWSKDIRGKLGGQSKIPHIDPTVDGELMKSLASYGSREYPSSCPTDSAS